MTKYLKKDTKWQLKGLETSISYLTGLNVLICLICLHLCCCYGGWYRERAQSAAFSEQIRQKRQTIRCVLASDNCCNNDRTVVCRLVITHTHTHKHTPFHHNQLRVVILFFFFHPFLHPLVPCCDRPSLQSFPTHAVSSHYSLSSLKLHIRTG